jgi:hypothetical protein
MKCIYVIYNVPVYGNKARLGKLLVDDEYIINNSWLKFQSFDLMISYWLKDVKEPDFLVHSSTLTEEEKQDILKLWEIYKELL